MGGAVPVPYQMPATGVIDSSGFNAGTLASLQFLLTPPKVVARNTSAGSFTNSTWTAVGFDTNDVDEDYTTATAGQHSTVTNTSRFTAIWPGKYLCNGVVAYALNATGARGARWAVNGTATNAVGQLLPSVAATFGAQVAAPGQEVYLNIGDYVELQGFQASGSPLASAAGCSFTIVWISN